MGAGTGDDLFGFGPFGSKMVHSPRSPFGRIGRDVRSRFKNAAVCAIAVRQTQPWNTRELQVGLDPF